MPTEGGGPSPETKEQVRRRDEYNCRLCGRESALCSEDIEDGERYYGGGLDLQVHHIEARRSGGRDEPKNLITVCKRCHQRIHEHESIRPFGLGYREFFGVYSD